MTNNHETIDVKKKLKKLFTFLGVLVHAKWLNSESVETPII